MPNQVLGLTERGDRDIALIDDMEMRREGIACLLRDWTKSNSILLATFASPAAFAESEGSGSFRMVILSVGGTMIDDPGVAAGIEQIRSSAPQANLVILSDHKDPGQIVAAFHSGAQGYMSMGIEPAVALRALGFILCGGTFFPPQALADLSQICAASAYAGTKGGPRPSGQITLPGTLTARQQEVLEQLRHGMSNKQIARELNMQEATVKVHIRQIMRRLGVRNRVLAALEATRLFNAAQADSQVTPEMSQGRAFAADVSTADQIDDTGTSALPVQQAGVRPVLPTMSKYGIY